MHTYTNKTLHYLALSCITLHCAVFQCIALDDTKKRTFMKLHCMKHWTTLHLDRLWYVTWCRSMDRYLHRITISKPASGSLWLTADSQYVFGITPSRFERWTAKLLGENLSRMRRRCSSQALGGNLKMASAIWWPSLGPSAVVQPWKTSSLRKLHGCRGQRLGRKQWWIWAAFVYSLQA